MNGEWKWTTLGNIASKGYGLVDGPFGSNLPASCYQKFGIPVIRGSNLTLGVERFIGNNFVYVPEEVANKLARSLTRPNDIVFTKKGTIGQTGLVPDTLSYDTYLISSNQMKLTVDSSKADPIFVYYFVSSPASRKKIKKDSEFTGVPKTNTKYLREFPICLPPLEEQKAIAAVLSCLDAKIENLRKQNETLERIAQTLFKHWFIDFEFPNEDGKPYKSSGGAMIPSELGEIPIDWRVGTLEDIVDVSTGFPFKSELYNFEEGIRVVRGENVSLGFLRWDTEKRWNLGIEDYQDYLLETNDYVIGMDGSRVGKNRTIVVDSDLPLILAQRVARLRAKENSFQAYVNILLMNNQFQKYVDYVKTGTSIPHISGKQIKDFECLIPTIDIVKSFDHFYKTWSSKISLIKKQIKTLTKTRDTLLPKLMSGQLRVKDL